MKVIILASNFSHNRLHFRLSVYTMRGKFFYFTSAGILFESFLRKSSYI